MVEPQSTRRLLNVLLDSLSDLRRYRAGVTRDELGGQRDIQHMVLHALYVAVQAAVDLAMHAGADEGLPEASTYQDAFRRLADAGLIERDLAGRLAGWAGFRNVLAHLYATIDYDRVYDALQETGDLEAFAKIVSRTLPP